MNECVYDRIKATRNLPTPKGVALELLKLVRHPEASLGAIAAVVEADPAISTRLLKLANSPHAGACQEVASVNRAVGLLGMKAVTRLALCFSLLHDNRTGRCASFNYDLFWSDSLGRAAAARVLVRRLHLVAPDEAFTCGLLCQIGRLALATVFPAEYGRLLEQAPEFDPAALGRCERAELAMDHAELAAAMMADWGLPALFCQAVEAQIEPDATGIELGGAVNQLARLLQLAGDVSAVLTHASAFRDVMSSMMMRANRLGIAPDVLPELFDLIRADWREAGQLLSIATADVPSMAELYAEAQRLRQTIDDDDPRSAQIQERQHALL